jgi:hypothetical protein
MNVITAMRVSLRLPVALLLEKEPTNLQAQSLAQLIDRAVTQGSVRPDSNINADGECSRGVYWHGARWGRSGVWNDSTRNPRTARISTVTQVIPLPSSLLYSYTAVHCFLS